MVFSEALGLYRFKMLLDENILKRIALRRKFFVPHPNTCSCDEFDCKLLRAWKHAMNSGVFYYDLNVQYKILAGPHALVAHLNVDRGSKRREPLPFAHLFEPFNDQMFNYTKIKDNEILTEVEELNGNKSVIIVNISPIEVGHSLLVPHSQKRLPQSLVPEALESAIRVLLASNYTNFHVVYNSLLACASVNHLHFHLYYLEHPLKLQNATARELVPLSLYLVDDWLFPTLAFQMINYDVVGFARNVFAGINVLQNADIAHNFFMTRAKRFVQQRRTGKATDLENEPNDEDVMFPTLFLFPRQKLVGAKASAGFNPAACELAGHILVYDEEFYASLTEEGVRELFEATVKLPDETFKHIVNMIVTELN